MQFNFNQKIIQNFSRSVKKEWMDSNKKGAYSASTIIGLNARREHGLFVVPTGHNRWTTTLAKLEESIFVENKLYEISTNRYVDAVFPHGYQYLYKFEINPFPKFSFQIEDRFIRKTVLLLENQNILLVRYELRNQGRSVKMVIKPFLAVRDNHSILAETQGLNTDSYLGQGWVRWEPKLGMPSLYMYFNRGEYIPTTLWYHNFFYEQDKDRYQKQLEDLFNPGFFQVELAPYETLDFFISAEELNPNTLDFESQYRQELLTRKKAQPEEQDTIQFIEDLKNNFKRVIPFPDPNQTMKTLPISRLDESSSTRDLLFSLFGLLCPEMEPLLFKFLVRTLVEKLNGGLLPSRYLQKETKLSYKSADLSLWLINIVYLYFKNSKKDLDFLEDEIFNPLKEIIDSYQKGTLSNIYADKDHLIFSGNKAISASWIPLKNKEGEALRYGKLLEVNGLWYSAVRGMEALATRLGKKRLANKYGKLADNVKRSFEAKFIADNEDSFYDFINHERKNKEFRINQLIPLAVPFSPVGLDFGRKVLDRIQQELITSYGVRSLSPQEASFGKFSKRRVTRKTVDYYNGAIWPWATLFYAQAYVRFTPPQQFKNNRAFWNDFSDLFQLTSEGLLGFIPEVVYQNEEALQGGMPDFLPAEAMILWADFILFRREQEVSASE